MDGDRSADAFMAFACILRHHSSDSLHEFTNGEGGEFLSSEEGKSCPLRKKGKDESESVKPKPGSRLKLKRQHHSHQSPKPEVKLELEEGQVDLAGVTKNISESTKACAKNRVNEYREILLPVPDPPPVVYNQYRTNSAADSELSQVFDYDDDEEVDNENASPQPRTCTDSVSSIMDFGDENVKTKIEHDSTDAKSDFQSKSKMPSDTGKKVNRMGFMRRRKIRRL